MRMGQEIDKMQEPVNYLAIISRAASDPNTDVAKIHGLIDANERMMAKQAEIEFNSDFVRLQADLPRITKDSKIMHNGRLISSYATYERIDDSIRPLLARSGFGLRYNSTPQGDKILISATLSHRAGHSITGTILLDFDVSGAKNKVQSVGSTIAYGKRYLAGMLLNLVFEGEDDDGKSAGVKAISDDQAEILKDLIRETGTDTVAFLSTMVSGARSVDDIAARDFERCRNALQAKKNKMVQP
ncbi:MAG: ERF family protein [Spirochaetes bacterium]|nr:MAG: ERF family protein [Spirochaetota bacterium]